MTISLPREMTREVDAARKREHRTRSELVREALRVYFGVARTLPVYTPTARELREIEKGRGEMRRGEYLTLDEFFSHLDVDSRRQQARSKGSRPSSATRTRTPARRA